MKFQLISQAYAQCTPGEGGVDLGDCLKLSDSTPVKEIYNNPAFLVNLLVRNLFIVAGVYFAFTLFMAGYKFITKGKEGIQEAQSLAINGLIGIIVMFSAYWIVQIVALITGADVGL
ncbi:MAG: hypothetical protein GW762_04705 [Candidatus Pacebacteria bacterium]|nr:hypothetical protein [Candidatus Paceibacterota bacterium]PIR64179.1 MAG: hypothetical protein COU64_00485 [Candidatus Pacebacteria bacterium CG10_big_fil_rev_8_21_14_0_10_40_26]PIZ79297.1 MAG: hypothetical protein COY01_02635 [Candidatus Pacebacteria bacterium CG_4_10_14_0_2_um_filter_40_20]PJA68953.1 MAG: hypothetical protein CO156_03245 [Candidatus Pacebacteria bacterium CG_4_9_14_3_um_filter_40_12]PJC42264.1 MAG: hypothetical protein CO041_01345 [Candidatus Pacebacteria bacterium CG_4_9_